MSQPNLTLPAIGLGTGAFTGGYGRVDEQEVTRTVQHALDIGVRMVDTADFYGDGGVESLIGRAIAGRRDDAFVATRGGLRWEPGGRRRADGNPEYLSRACDASLRRLGVERIDLYYLARIDPLVPVEESVGRLAELVRAGKIRYVGLAKASAEHLRRAHAVHPVSAIAQEYSLLDRRAESGDLAAARRAGTTFVACRPLARGLLTGRIASADRLDPGDYRRTDPRFGEASMARVKGRLAAAEAMAARKDLSLSRLALAWLLAQPGVVPVPSTRNRLHLEMNSASVDVRLTADERDHLAAIFPATALDVTEGGRHEA